MNIIGLIKIPNPTEMKAIGSNLNIVLTFSTCSSENGPPYFLLPRFSREG